MRMVDDHHHVPHEIVREVPYEVVREIPKEIPIEVTRSMRGDVPYWQRNAQRDDFERQLNDRKMARSRDSEMAKPFRLSDRGMGGSGMGGSGMGGSRSGPRREPIRSSGAGMLTGGR